jgi:hypothetical protein
MGDQIFEDGKFYFSGTFNIDNVEPLSYSFKILICKHIHQNPIIMLSRSKYLQNFWKAPYSPLSTKYCTQNVYLTVKHQDIGKWNVNRKFSLSKTTLLEENKEHPRRDQRYSRYEREKATKQREADRLANEDLFAEQRAKGVAKGPNRYLFLLICGGRAKLNIRIS